MEIVKIKDEYIKLGQSLKLAGMVNSGIDAKCVIQDGLVQVNGKIEYQRGKKVYAGDTVTFDHHSFTVEKCL